MCAKWIEYVNDGIYFFCYNISLELLLFSF